MMSNEFDRKFNFMWNFIWIWFIFVAVLSISIMGGSAYVVFLLLQHFGVI